MTGLTTSSKSGYMASPRYFLIVEQSVHAQISSINFSIGFSEGSDLPGQPVLTTKPNISTHDWMSFKSQEFSDHSALSDGQTFNETSIQTDGLQTP